MMMEVVHLVVVQMTIVLQIIVQKRELLCSYGTLEDQAFVLSDKESKFFVKK